MRTAAHRISAFAGRLVRNERASLHLVAHDVPAMHAALLERRIRPLVNESAHVRGDGVDLWVAGVDDLAQGKPDLDRALNGVPAGRPLVLMSHHPDIWWQAGANRADLILAGHTHGGQIRLPLLGALYMGGTRLPRGNWPVGSGAAMSACLSAEAWAKASRSGWAPAPRPR